MNLRYAYFFVSRAFRLLVPLDVQHFPLVAPFLMQEAHQFFERHSTSGINHRKNGRLNFMQSLTGKFDNMKSTVEVMLAIEIRINPVRMSIENTGLITNNPVGLNVGKTVTPE